MAGIFYFCLLTSPTPLSHNLIPFTKLPLSYHEQLDLLIQRGLNVVDKEKAVRFLAYCNYYRFSGYVVPFESQRDVFRENVDFEDIRELYEYDHKLRKLIFDGISIIEIFARTKIAYQIAMTSQSAFGHFQVLSFCNKKVFKKLTLKLKDFVETSEETFVKNYKEKYSDFPKLPIWITTEIIPFGTLSRLYQSLCNDIKRGIAKEFGIHFTILESWLHSLSTLRNSCAHYSRIWNRHSGVLPTLPQDENWIYFQRLSKHDYEHCTRRIFPLLSIICYLLKRIQEQGGMSSNWRQDAIQLIKSHPKTIDNFEWEMGIPDSNWENSMIWKTDM